MITLTIPIPTPSLNAMYWRHWSKKLKDFRKWRKWIWALKSELKCSIELEHMENKRHVTIDRYGARLLDRDNLIGGCKSIVDSLVAEGFLINDDPDHVVVEYHQRISKERKTIIKIMGETEWASTKEQLQNSPKDSQKKLTGTIAIADRLL